MDPCDVEIRIFNDNIHGVMKSIAFRRVAALLVVLTFVVGLPMQGMAMAPQASLSTSGEMPMPDGCTGCGDVPATSMICPIVFCIGLSAIVVEQPELIQIPFCETWTGHQLTCVGQTFSPDPHPPRV